jgi:hypothetical protein
MPTQAQITAASDELSDVAQAQLLALIRSSPRYKDQPDFYKLPADAIAAADGTVKARQLNAALALVDTVGDGTVALTGGEEGVDYSQERDLNQLVDYIISVLYEQPPRRSILSTSATNETGF